jgi:hypothetical protein
MASNDDAPAMQLKDTLNNVELALKFLGEAVITREAFSDYVSAFVNECLKAKIFGPFHATAIEEAYASAPFKSIRAMVQQQHAEIPCHRYEIDYNLLFDCMVRSNDVPSLCHLSMREVLLHKKIFSIICDDDSMWNTLMCRVKLNSDQWWVLELIEKYVSSGKRKLTDIKVISKLKEAMNWSDGQIYPGISMEILPNYFDIPTLLFQGNKLHEFVAKACERGELFTGAVKYCLENYSDQLKEHKYYILVRTLDNCEGSALIEEHPVLGLSEFSLVECINKVPRFPIDFLNSILRREHIFVQLDDSMLDKLMWRFNEIPKHVLRCVEDRKEYMVKYPHIGDMVRARFDNGGKPLTMPPINRSLRLQIAINNSVSNILGQIRWS